MPICPICDDTGLRNSDSTNPEFCYCAAGKQARRQWETDRAREKQGKQMPKPASFIDIAQLEQVNASVDAMRASLLGSAPMETGAVTRHPAVQLLYQVAHPGHEISIVEATQLHDLAKVLEVFLAGLAPIGRRSGQK
ncbi:MAG TPA: hypothetical protein VKR06_41050 [Ktedonosporobacter sp.]|nr:hypothetical protein [Ktedonosporobacter sp.]